MTLSINKLSQKNLAIFLWSKNKGFKECRSNDKITCSCRRSFKRKNWSNNVAQTHAREIHSQGRNAKIKTRARSAKTRRWRIIKNKGRALLLSLQRLIISLILPLPLYQQCGEKWGERVASKHPLLEEIFCIGMMMMEVCRQWWYCSSYIILV